MVWYGVIFMPPQLVLVWLIAGRLLDVSVPLAQLINYYHDDIYTALAQYHQYA